MATHHFPCFPNTQFTSVTLQSVSVTSPIRIFPQASTAFWRPCACVGEGGRTILKRGARMGHRPSWLPVAPLYGGQQAVLAVWLPALLAPGRFTTEGLVWVTTSGGGRLGGLRTGAPVAGHLLHSSARPLAGGGGLPPALSSSLALEGPRAQAGPLPCDAWPPGSPPFSWRATTGRAGECCPSAALLRKGARMPNVPPGATVPNLPPHCVCVCVCVCVCARAPVCMCHALQCAGWYFQVHALKGTNQQHCLSTNGRKRFLGG